MNYDFRLFTFGDVAREIFDRLHFRDRLKKKRLDLKVALTESEKQRHALEFEVRCLAQVYYVLSRLRNPVAPIYAAGSLRNSDILLDLVR